MCNEIKHHQRTVLLRSDIRNEIPRASLFPVKDIGASKVGKVGVRPARENKRKEKKKREKTERSSTCNANQDRKFQKRKKETSGHAKLE